MAYIRIAVYRLHKKTFIVKNYSSFMIFRGYTEGDERVKKSGGMVIEKQYADLYKSKRTIDNNLSRFVDLTSSKGITVKHTQKESENSALIRQCLHLEPNKYGFIKSVDIFINKNKTRHGHINFITTAMKFIEPYGLEKDVDVYNKLIDVFPRNRFDNRTLFDAVWPRAHPQINLALDLLTKMEWKHVMPTDETRALALEVFGRASFPVQKIDRMTFWFDKFKDINIYELNDDVYKDQLNIIRAAIDRILGNNDGTKIVELSSGIEEKDIVIYKRFIISSQTRLQQRYIDSFIADQPLYIEGPAHIWINHKMEEYFVLKTGKSCLTTSSEFDIQADEEREGVLLAVCFATKPFKETLQKWLSHLQELNPSLKRFNIIFNIDEDNDVASDHNASEAYPLLAINSQT